MLTHETRKFPSTKTALLAVLLAITPNPKTLQAQPKPPDKAEKEVDPMVALYQSADKAYSEKKYKESLAIFQDLETKGGEELLPMYKAAITYRKALCLYSLKDWPRTQVELTNFLDKYPKGTEGFFDKNDDFRNTAQLLLAEVLTLQNKWDLALPRLEKIRTDTLARPLDRINAYRLSAKAVIDRAKNAPDNEKKTAYSQAITLLKQATATGINTPEQREAAYQLVEVYTKLGLVTDATQLKNAIDAKTTGSPIDAVKSNIQRLEIGDSRFAAAETTADDATRADYYRQALDNYQGTLRRSSLTKLFVKALETKQSEVESFKSNTPKPNPEQEANLRNMQLELENLKKSETEFIANKDYDALISYRIGLCLLELKRPWEAHVAFLDIFDNSPGFSRISGAFYYDIIALRRIGRNSEAQQKCKDFIKKFPNDDVVSNIGLILGEISQEREEYPEAIAHYKWVQSNVKKLSPEIAEEIDFRIAACDFSQQSWDPAQKSFESFLKKYGRSPARQQVLYMNALCSFFQGKYKDTKDNFDKYQSEYPKGQFIPDVRYRQGVVKLGTNPPDIAGTIQICEDWLKDYLKDTNEDVITQIPEVYTLIGDAYMKLIEVVIDKKLKDADFEVRNNIKSPDKAKVANLVAARTKLEKEKEETISKAIDAYEAAAKKARSNPQTLEFVLGEIRKLLPGRGEHKRMRDLYQEIFDWDHNSPKAMTYLYEVIRCTERMGNMGEFSTETETIRKEFSAKLAEARKSVDQLERKPGITQPEIDKAKEGVKKLSTELEEALKKVESKRQASIEKQKNRALEILSKAVAETINNRKQEGTEKLILFLAEKLARKIKRVKPGAKPAPGNYTFADAEKEMAKLLRLEENRSSLVAQARGFFAQGQLAVFAREPEKAEANFIKIAANFKAEELNPTIIAVVGDTLLAKGDQKKASDFYAYLLEHGRSSEYADFGFAGLAEIRLAEKKYKEALALCNEAIENNILMSKELEIRFVRARALAETKDYVNAKKEFDLIAETKEWRGEKTAASLYWLGQIHERQATDANGYNQAITYYRRCFLSWKKYEVWAARSYLSTAKLFGSKLDQKNEAKTLITQMLMNERIKATREAEEAKAYILGL